MEVGEVEELDLEKVVFVFRDGKSVELDYRKLKEFNACVSRPAIEKLIEYIDFTLAYRQHKQQKTRG